MPLVDYERAWLRLKATIDSKPSHGTRDLLREMSRIEVACELPEAEQLFDSRPMPRPTPAHDDPLVLEEPVASA